MLLQDLRIALRGLRRAPAFSVIVLVTLALGIGANAAIFSVVNGVLLRPLPFADADRVVHFTHDAPYGQVSEPEYMDYRRDLPALERIAAYAGADGTLSGGLEPRKIDAARVSDGFFSVLGVSAALGRTFSPTEEAPRAGPSPVVIISSGLWRGYFGATADIVGKTIQLNGVPRTVIGVMPARFDFPSATTSIWLPLRLNPDSLWTRNNHYLQLVGKVRAGGSVAQARVEAATLDARWMHDFPETYFPGKQLVPDIQPMKDLLLGPTRPYLLALLGAVGLVLLIACANVANLLLARGESRRKELAIRAALGASGKRLATQVLTESGLLALGGGIIGLGIAQLLGRLLVALAPGSLPRLEEVRLDGGVVAFTVVVSVMTGLLFGTLPALRANRGRNADALKDGGRTAAFQGGARARHALVVAEVMLSVVMLAGAGLLLRSLVRLEGIDLGFEPAKVLTVRLDLPPLDYTRERAVAFIRNLEDRVRTMNDVRSVATMGRTPLGGGDIWSIWIDGHIIQSVAESPTASPQQITAGYFATMGIPIIKGRAFTEADREDAPLVTVINEAMARQLWSGQDPIGHTLKMMNKEAPWATIVGMARDIKSSGALAPTPPTMYFPYSQAGKSAYYTPLGVSLAVRTRDAPESVAGAVRQAIRSLDRNVPISDVQSMEDVVGTAFTGRRFTTVLLVAFAALALLLAGVGIYGVISYSVSQRTYEIGLRMALGAERRSVLELVVTEGLRLTGIGLGIGLVGAVVVGQLVRSLLVGTSAADPMTLGAVAAILIGVAVVASVVPARRAMAVSPTEALRGG